LHPRKRGLGRVSVASFSERAIRSAQLQACFRSPQPECGKGLCTAYRFALQRWTSGGPRVFADAMSQ